MRVIQWFAVLAVRDLLPAALGALGLEAGAGSAGRVAGFLIDHFSEHGERLAAALEAAAGRSWSALEVALAGETLWNRLDRAEDRAVRRRLARFLDSLLPTEAGGDPLVFRQRCLDELRAARREGLLSGGVDLDGLARSASDLARLADPAAHAAAEDAALADLARPAAERGYAHLARLLQMRPADAPPLLVTAFRYFFRRAVESDRQLFQGLAWARWERLARDQERGFAQLEQALDEARQAHAAIRDLRDEQRRQGDRFDELYRVVLDVRQRLDVAPDDSLAVRGDDERRLLRDVLARYRALPAEQQRQLPALLSAVAELQLRAGDSEGAEHSYQEVAALAADQAARAEAHYHAFRAALRRYDWEKALSSWRRAAGLDRGRWTRDRLRQELRTALHGAPPEARTALRAALARRPGPSAP